MSISIYYIAQRKKELSLSEIKAIKEIATKYSVNAQIENLVATGVGLNWESFHFLTNTERPSLFKKAVVFSGSTKLPDNSADATWIGVQHWCECLSELRQLLNTCDWSASVDDHNMHWDPQKLAYDPSK